MNDERLFRETVREFTRREIAPHLDEWERAGEVPRELHRKAAQAGILGVGFGEDVGGAGGDFTHSVVVTEELIGAGGSSGLCAALFTHGIGLPHIVAAGTPDQIDRFVRPTLAGETISALAVTEPGGGSDVASLRTIARRDRGDYVVDGAKTFITSGCRADFVVVAARTGGEGYEGISLLVVERGMPSFHVSRKLEKMGWACSDTAELAFDGVRVPAHNLIGEQEGGFRLLMRHFVSERLGLATHAYAIAQRCFDLTREWVRERKTFGARLADRQVVRHKLAEMATEAEVAREYVRGVARRYAAGEDVAREAAMAKNAAVRACERVVYDAVQLHGGLGYMREIEVERHYRDARILALGGGTTEIMNELIAARLGLDD